MRRTVGWATALVGTLAVVATLFMTTTYREWYNWGPHHPVAATAGASAGAHGWDWRLQQAYARTTFTDGSPVPPDLRLVVATVEVRPAGPDEAVPASCDPRLWIDGAGWFDVGADYGALLPESADMLTLGVDTLGCYLPEDHFAMADSATYTWAFVVPADRLAEAGEVSVDVTTRFVATSGMGNATFPRLTVDPDLLR